MRIRLIRSGNIPDYALLIELSTQEAEPLLEDRLISFVMARYDEGGDKPIIYAVTGKAEGLWALRHHISEGLRQEEKSLDWISLRPVLRFGSLKKRPKCC